MDIPLILCLFLAIFSLWVYLLPRLYRKRKLTIPLINRSFSVVGPFRVYSMRIATGFVYLLLFLIVMREYYLTDGCPVSQSYHDMLLAIQHRLLGLFNAHNIPIWADSETLKDVLYFPQQPLPSWKYYQTFSSLYNNDRGVELIQQLIAHDQVLCSQFDKSTETLRVSFCGHLEPYIDIILWREEIRKEETETGQKYVENRVLVTQNQRFEFPVVHYYEVFPLRPAVTSTVKATGMEILQFNNDMNTIHHDNDHHLGENKTPHPCSIWQPNEAHHVALRGWSGAKQHRPHDNQHFTMKREGLREQCMSNLVSRRFLPIMYRANVQAAVDEAVADMAKMAIPVHHE